MTTPTFRVGQRVRHRGKDATGTVEAVVTRPLARLGASHVVVMLDGPGGSKYRRTFWAADLELIDPAVAPQPEPGLTVVTLGVLAEPPARKVGRFAVIDGGRS